MIVPMKKICFLVPNENRNDALVILRDIGVIHVEKTNISTENLTKALDRKVKVEEALALIKPYKTPKKEEKPKETDDEERERRKDLGIRRGRRATDKMGIAELEPYSLDAINTAKRPDLVTLMNGMGEDLKGLQDKSSSVSFERGRIEGWGNFNPKDIFYFAKAGYPIHLYELSYEEFATLEDSTRYVMFNTDSKNVRVLVLDDEIPELIPFQLPEKSLVEIDDELNELEEKTEALTERIKSFASRRSALDKSLDEADSDIEFEATMAEFSDIEEIKFESGFSLLKGYAPVETLPRLRITAEDFNWGFISDDPGPEDEVPTLLKNNRFVELLYPLTTFLDLVPGYREVDVSPWFLLFFTIFFGMIFGDAAYGCLLLIVALVGILKTRKTGIPLAFKMLTLFCVSNIIWGTLTCTWFGVDIEKLPEFFRTISFSPFSTAKGTSQIIVNQNLQLFCFVLALLQLGIARFTAFFIALKNKNLVMFAHIGNLGMLIGMFNIILFLVVSNETRSFPLLPVSLYLMGGGFLLNFIFGYYDGSISQSILSSLKNIIPVVLGVTGVFSDIMSYIRLWAVGLAGASLAATINTMAGPMLGNFMVFIGIILLCFGHGLNIILNVLSVLVHGVRLNILEFSGHIGLVWSGTAFKPFAETAKK